MRDCNPKNYNIKYQEGINSPIQKRTIMSCASRASDPYQDYLNKYL